MKILWLAHRDPMNPKAGGAERIIYEIGKRLLSHGHEVTIFTGGWRDSKREDYLDGITIIRFGKRLGPHIALPIHLLTTNYDIVIADLGHAVPWISPILMRKKVIVSFLHLHARSLPGQVGKMLAYIITALEKLYFIIYNSQQFVTISSTSYKDLTELGINKSNIALINPGVNSEFFKPSIKTNHPSMVYFGGMRPYKRPEESLYLLSLLRNKIDCLKLTIIGEGISKPGLEKLAKDLGVINDVIFTGKISYEKISKLVSMAWLNIHTSKTEGWGISITEASAAGTPTVAYDVPGVRDAVEDGRNGIKVKDGNREALADAAFSILNDPERWWSSSIEVAKKYSWDATAELWENLIRKVANAQK
jgi:glycosyltransferase involved in cell wall biosynthesis